MTDLLYVGNLPQSATEGDLTKKFGRFGKVVSAVIVTEAKEGRSRRYGLVEMSSPAEARAAIGWFNMSQFDDTVISVSFSHANQQKTVTED